MTGMLGKPEYTLPMMRRDVEKSSPTRSQNQAWPAVLGDEMSNNKTLQQLIDEIKLRCEAATPGPWRIDILRMLKPRVEDVYRIGAGGLPEGSSSNNAEFIAHARTDIPKLVEALEKCITQRDFYALALLGETGPDFLEEYQEDLELSNSEIETILAGEEK